jgi:formate dehydrogenase major subunit/formate dehydrogenase alpha subunit
MLEAATEGKLRALYVMKSDPATRCPGGKEALEKLNFLVVQDLFLTETAQLADVVLPAASFAETEGTFTNLTGRMQRVRKALRPPGEARADDQIVLELIKNMGGDLRFTKAAEVRAEITKLEPVYESMGSKLTPVEYELPASDERYPLALVTGRLLYDGDIRLAQSDIMRQFVPEPFVEINPADAKALGIADGATVTVASLKGELKLMARVTGDIRPGCVFVPCGFPEAPVSALLDKKPVVTWVKVTK